MDTDTRETADDKFRIWLMWRPSGAADGARVPLAVASWHWKAVATRTGKGTGCASEWTLSAVDASGGHGVATSVLPTWTTNVKDLDYGPGTCP